ncbi:hypothetical protein MKEN_00603300 [Mycena kentingensis (nom. inval.)]|nr:hypothetical protein MKEN_00603300 [Mycena kentingensis (nom. inval.)]
MAGKKNPYKPKPLRLSTGNNRVSTTMRAAQASSHHRQKLDAREQQLASMSSAQRTAQQAQFDIPDNEPMDTHEDEVLRGETQMDISAEGEVRPGADLDGYEMYEEVAAHHGRTAKRRRVDRRKRWHRSQLIVDGFGPQMANVADAYEDFELFRSQHGPYHPYTPPEGAIIDSQREIFVVDVVAAQYTKIHFLRSDRYTADSLVRQGLFPCSPYFPSVAFTFATLELFHSLHLRCPRLGKQAFLRTLCDLTTTAPRDYLQKQFTIAYDLFLRTKDLVRRRVAKDLGRDHPDWRLKNGCPCCFYKLKGEKELKPAFLVTMDGNNSLKRLERREHLVRGDGTTVPGSSVESEDRRKTPGTLYLSEEFVNRFDKHKIQAGDTNSGPKVGCGDGWKNAQEKYTLKSWGMYRETGIFVLLCRHSMVLIICDMVESGEAAKYPLATVAHLLEVLGSCLIGYDIGCQFHEWAKKHPELAPHHRLCQLLNLPLYTKGCGLEASENAEAFFSKSNALAGVTRTASRFHRQQEIVEYMTHANVKDAYANISSLLVSKYKNAIEVLDSLPALETAMQRLGVEDRSVFETWLEEQREKLQTVVEEPEPEETLSMEYYQKLVNLQAQERTLQGFDSDDVAMSGAENMDLERRRRQAEERRDKTLAQVHALELRLGIQARWLPDSEEWREASRSCNELRYRRALDRVERLVIARLLELGKVSLASTGYQLRQLISKALQARSKALRNAIDEYNTIARLLNRQILDWNQVVASAFISEFDLLRLGGETISKYGWAHPGAREAMDHHFRLLRAVEERIRLDIEIKRLVTYMRDEERFLRHHEKRLEEEGRPARAHQVQKLRMEQGRYNPIHMERLTKLSKLTGFTGDITPGEAVSSEREVPTDNIPSPSNPTSPAPPISLLSDVRQGGEEMAAASAEELATLAEAGGYEGDDETDDEDEGLGKAVEQILNVTGDGDEDSPEQENDGTIDD